MIDTEENMPIEAHTEKTEASESTPPYPNTPMAQHSMEAIAKHVSEELTAKDMLDVLQSALRVDPDGVGMMYTQTPILDQLFHRLTINAMSAADKDGNPVKHYVNDKRIDLLLRMQKQCRATVEALNTIRARKEGKFENLIKNNHEQTIKDFN